MRFQILKTLLAVSSAALILGSAIAAQEPYAPNRIPDVSNTKHNFSASANPQLPTGNTRSVYATSQSEVCVFCHTPHYAGVDGVKPALPLWNHEATAVGTYAVYTSDTLTATPAPGQPGDASKMCLSCHDGTVAVGSVLAVNKTSNVTKDGAGLVTSITPTPVTMVGVAGDGTLANVSIDDTGYTMNLGTDLTNDHPIAFTYDSALAASDGELVDPVSTDYIATRQGRLAVGVGGTTQTRMAAPLEADKMECTTCHDPHLRGIGTAEDRNIKFLRMNRFQHAQPAEGSFTVATDIGCIGCHQKAGWAESAHANQTTATAQYENSAADQRDFPHNLQVWEAGCLNCHDTHTEKGADYLLREGATVAYDGPKQEETCFQCHGTSGKSVLQTPLIDLETLVTGANGHDVSSNESHTLAVTGEYANLPKQSVDGDHVETAVILGTNHVECGDCHHPHRAKTSKVFDESHADVTAVVVQPSPNWGIVDFSGQGTHVHESNTLHTNIASGALRGTFGIEPAWGAPVWGTAATFTELYDDPSETATEVVTREYQVCLKCHSNYANPLGSTNIDTEIQPSNDVRDVTNHNSWHPIAGATGRTNYSHMESPFDVTGAAGVQTMYCSDCHSSDNSLDGRGPHGSLNAKILVATGNDLCLGCHKSDVYSNSAVADFQNPPATLSTSGFSCTSVTDCVSATSPVSASAIVNDNNYRPNLHVYHAAANPGAYICTDCHVAQPHGWQNKALLADMSDEGQVVAGGPYTLSPYYLATKVDYNDTGNSGSVFAPSEDWQQNSCGTVVGCH